MFYHARITCKPDRAKEVPLIGYEYDLSKDDVLSKIAVPFVRRDQFYCGGVVILPEKVSEVKFNVTQQSSQELKPLIEARRRMNGVLSGTSALKAVVSEGRDVTREILDEAASYNNGRKLPKANEVKSDRVFIVHGHDQTAVDQTEILIRRFGLTPIILRNEPNRGNTVIEKFEAHAQVGLAIVLLTPDDVGCVAARAPDALLGRARQNVIWEWGYLVAKLGRPNVICLYKTGVELPSDLHGLVTINIGAEPKAHGLGYFYPPKNSPEGWEHETPQWIFEAWDWSIRGVLGLKRRKPSWFNLPVMMKLTLSTPHHALKNLAKGPLMRPNNFMMIPQISRFGYPQDVDPNKCTFITSFSSERDRWMQSKCINIHDPQSRVYKLADEYDGRRAVPKNFFMLLESYQNHPEAKSLGPDGKPCEFDTRGLLRRAHIAANWPPIYIGKESDRHWEEGEDLSLLDFKAIEYKRKGYAIATDEQLARIAKVPKREFIRRGINQHTLEKICNRKPVRTSKLSECLRVLALTS